MNETTGAGRYTLSDAENERIFRRWIVPERLAHATAQEHPTVFVLVGQPGAGKTRLAKQAAVALDRLGGGRIEVDSDVFKTYHPEYRQLMAVEGGKNMAACTGADGRRWKAKVQDYIREHRLNAIVHETVQNPPFLAQTLQTYRDAGYRIAVHAMGVPEALSRQAILAGYQQEVEDRGAGRLTVAANAAASYIGILDGADLIDRQRLADAVAVFRRGEAEPFYRNHLTSSGEWHSPPRLRAAIEAERAWLTAAEAAQFRDTQTRLRASMDQAEWRRELDTVDALARPLEAAQVARAGFPFNIREALAQPPATRQQSHQHLAGKPSLQRQDRDIAGNDVER